MQELTFGEQVKIILSRKGMTIKELAERVEAHTGKPMSRQNMTQKLHRDNFQEQDMRMLAEILGCEFVLNIMGTADTVKSTPATAETVDTEQSTSATAETVDTEQCAPTTAESVDDTQTVLVPENSLERDITVGELLDTEQKFKGFVGFRKGKLQETAQETATQETAAQESATQETAAQESDAQETVAQESDAEPGESLGDINPYTGKEYASNSVRMHPKRIGYVQVYDQTEHKWTDMTEWAFLGFQERKKALLGKDYEPPIYLD